MYMMHVNRKYTDWNLVTFLTGDGMGYLRTWVYNSASDSEM